MLYGFNVAEDMIHGLANWMDGHGLGRLSDLIGAAVGNVVDWR